MGPAEAGVAIQGPSAKAAVLGPDGSAISGAAIGGTVLSPPKLGGAITAAVSPGIVAAAAPLAVAAPLGLAAPLGGAILAGPSGTVATAGLGLAAPLGLGLGGLGVKVLG